MNPPPSLWLLTGRLLGGPTVAGLARVQALQHARVLPEARGARRGGAQLAAPPAGAGGPRRGAAGRVRPVDLLAARHRRGGVIRERVELAHAPAVRSVVGIGAWYTPDAKTRAGLQGLDLARLEREPPARAAFLARQHDAHQTPGYWRDLLGWVTTGLAEARPAADLQRIAVPTLWIVGENDAWFELDQLLAMKRHLPGAELLLVNHAEHSVQMSHPHLVGPC
jgi:pimeloyl-ACP methyl ester carboxylesterase